MQNKFLEQLLQLQNLTKMMNLYLLYVMIISSVSAFRYNYVDPRIYSFAFNGIQPGSFFDGEKLTGVRVELMKEVCCRAGKRCVGALVSFDQCLNNNFLSPVLDNRWHDVCLELVNSPRRAATFEFSNITFWNLTAPTLVARKDSKITLEDLRDPRHNHKVAFMSDPELVTSPGLERFKKEFFVKPENEIPIPTGGPNDAVDEIFKLVNDSCGEVVETVGIVAYELLKNPESVRILTKLGEDLGQLSLMVRKDEQAILDWWDYTLKRFMCSPDYEDFCERMDREFGVNPLNCPDRNQVDCSDCTIPHRVPGCECPGNQI